MAFDVSKFLALTVLIAGTGASCTAADDKDEPGAAGTAGSAGQNSAGSNSNPGGADQGGAGGGEATGKGGEAGGFVVGGASAGAGVGGAGLGGAESGGGGAGGAPEVGECLGELAVGGAGGAGGVDLDPSLEGLCSDFYQTDCGDELLPPSYTVCAASKDRDQPAVAVAIADCITALSLTDECDSAKVKACYSGVVGKGCANPDSVAACNDIIARAGCEAVTQADCEKVANLVNPAELAAFTECMDPSIEGYYNPDFTGTCAERLESCAGLWLE